LRRYLAECIATFFLVFAGTGAIIANDVYMGVIGHVGISLSFGLVVMSMIYGFGEISGAHLNPAVTFGFYVLKRINLKNCVMYILFQCMGAILASLFLKLVFPMHVLLGATFPGVSVWAAFVYELILTFFLMFVILSVATGAKEKGVIAAIAIGGIVGLEALFAGPVTGASMNPARSLGPAVVSGYYMHLWIYLVSCPLGAVLACKAYVYLNDKG